MLYSFFEALRVELQAAPLSPRPLALRAAQEQALDQVQALEAALNQDLALWNTIVCIYTR